jgi:hypothetical protein
MIGIQPPRPACRHPLSKRARRLGVQGLLANTDLVVNETNTRTRARDVVRNVRDRSRSFANTPRSPSAACSRRPRGRRRETPEVRQNTTLHRAQSRALENSRCGRHDTSVRVQLSVGKSGPNARRQRLRRWRTPCAPDRLHWMRDRTRGASPRSVTPRGTPAVPTPPRPSGVQPKRLRSDAPTWLLTPAGAIDLRHRDELVVGRDPSCELVLPDPLVSRRHARLVFSLGEVTIEDSSTNGVYVNDVRVERKARLYAGDRILLGTSELSAF